MGEDLTAQADKYALYVPSLQFSSARQLTSTQTTIRGRKLPVSLQFKDFNYLDTSNRFWNYGYCLCSAMTFMTSKQPTIISRRTSDIHVIGDSGGFQLGEGSFKEAAQLRHLSPDEIIEELKVMPLIDRLLNWLHINCDSAMSVDIPPWSNNKPKSPFKSFTDQHFLDANKDTMAALQESRRNSSLAFYNILHGETEQAEQEWFDQFKNAKLNGWAFGGNVGISQGWYRPLRRAKLLLEAGLINNDCNKLHLLKLSRPMEVPMATALQRQVRNNFDTFRVTYDSSTPYQEAGARNRYLSMPLLGKKRADWSLIFNQFPVGHNWSQSTPSVPMRLINNVCIQTPNCNYCTAQGRHLPNPMSSPIAQLLTLQDVNGVMPHNGPSGLDAFGLEVLINHNVYILIKTLIAANDAVFVTQDAPDQVLEAVGIVEDVFRRQDWDGYLSGKKTALKKLLR